MAGSTYEFFFGPFGDGILRADYMVAEMGRRGQKVLDRAIATAPVYEGPGEDEHRGRYKASFSMRTTTRGGYSGNRAAAIIENSAPEALYVEVGVRPDKHEPAGQRAHHTLMNARYAAGD